MRTKKEINRTYFFLPILLIAVGYSSDIESPGTQEYLFAVRYEIAAWVPKSVGLVIDRKGNVSLYDLVTVSGHNTIP
jgi:hypothetical protein